LGAFYPDRQLVVNFIIKQSLQIIT
jgi:hypothetical protein